MKKLLTSIGLGAIIASFLNVSIFANTTYFPDQMNKSFYLNSPGAQDVAKISVTDPAKISLYYKQYEEAYKNIMASSSFEIQQNVVLTLSVDNLKSQIVTNSLVQQVDLNDNRIASNVFTVSNFIDTVYDAKTKSESLNIKDEEIISNVFFKDDVLYYDSQVGKFRIHVEQDEYFDILFGEGFLPFDSSTIKKVYTQNYTDGQYVTFVLNDAEAKDANQLAAETALSEFNLTSDDSNQKGNEVGFSFFFDTKGNLIYFYNEFTTYLMIDGLSTKISSKIANDILVGETTIEVPEDLNSFKYVDALNYTAE